MAINLFVGQVGNLPFATCNSAAPVGQPIPARAAFQAAFRPSALSSRTSRRLPK
jgi:hypothetical protein